MTCCWCQSILSSGKLSTKQDVGYSFFGSNPKAGEACLLDQDSRDKQICTVGVFLEKSKSSQQDKSNLGLQMD